MQVGTTFRSAQMPEPVVVFIAVTHFSFDPSFHMQVKAVVAWNAWRVVVPLPYVSGWMGRY